MDRHHRMERLLSWLSFMPPLENIARFLVLDYLAIYKPVKCLIWRLNVNDSLILLASYGDEEVSVGNSVPGSVWRTSSEGASLALLGTPSQPISWFDHNKQAVINLYAQSILIGFLLVNFDEPIDDLDEFVLFTTELSWQISLYLALQFHNFMGLKSEGTIGSRAGLTDSSNEKIVLSQRQRSILLALAAKKTNHEIATELGFSVSTIRHETMRIFENLGVSGRAEAAFQARKLGLL